MRLSLSQARLHRAIRPVIERFESRRLMSIAVVGGVLTVDFSTNLNAHTIVVGASGENYTVTNNGRTKSFSQDGIDSLNILGTFGSNNISIQTTFPDLNSDDGIKGGPASDIILGSTSGHEIFFGGQGNDSITARGSGNIINGGSDNDTIVGANGDTLFGNDGNDSIVCGTGNNFAVGGIGNDTLIAGSGNDTLYGKEGADSIVGGPGNDFLQGGTGPDTLQGGSGRTTLSGGRGSDLIASAVASLLHTAAQGHDLLDGGLGRDTLIPGTGTDTVTGGPGADDFYTQSGATYTDFTPSQGDFNTTP